MASGFSSGALEGGRVECLRITYPELSGFHCFIGFEDDLGHGLALGMRDRKMGADRPEFLEEFRCLAVKGHRGPSTGEAPDFDIVPCDTSAPTGSRSEEHTSELQS